MLLCRFVSHMTLSWVANCNVQGHDELALFELPQCGTMNWHFWVTTMLSQYVNYLLFLSILFCFKFRSVRVRVICGAVQLPFFLSVIIGFCLCDVQWQISKDIYFKSIWNCHGTAKEKCTGVFLNDWYLELQE